MAKSDMQTIAERIRDRFTSLTRAEKQLADALMANYPVAGLTSITALARSAGVSTPTVLRTAKKLGFSGFPAFKSALRAELKATLSNPISKHERWTSSAPDGHILNTFADAVLENLRRSLAQIDHNAFDETSAMLADPAQSIHIAGGRITHTLADYLFTHLQVIREDVVLLQTSAGLWPHSLLDMKAGDVLVIFDIRRYENDLIELATLASKQGVEIVLFTDQWMSPIAALAKHAFNARIEVPSGWDSSVATLFLVEALIASVEESSWTEASARMKRLETIFDTTRHLKKR
ncbi:MAG: MurR/RpiR family transcriptional regulator [Pseudomonadota bacterium]